MNNLRVIEAPEEIFGENYSVTVERMLLRRPCKMHLQADFLGSVTDNTKKYFRVAAEAKRLLTVFLCRNVKYLDGVNPDKLGIFIEKMIHTVWGLTRIQNSHDFWYFINTTSLLFTDKCSISNVITWVNTNLQADDQSEDWYAKFKYYFADCKKLKNSPFVGQIRDLYLQLFANGLLEQFGLKATPAEMKKCMNGLRGKDVNQTEMVFSAIELSIQFIDRYCCYKQTGSLRSALLDEDESAKWAIEAERLIALSPFTANLEPHGTTYFNFLSDLGDAIEMGEAYLKFSSSAGNFEQSALKQRLARLQLIKNSEITKRAATQGRKAPFGILVHGGSSIGKSTFEDILFSYYGRLHGLSTEDHFKYTRNFFDAYWSNFSTSMWCVVLDDIAFRLPKKSPDVDPSLVEAIAIMNNVAFCPPQADLADKGKTPLKARLVIASTNTIDLNADEYFSCPLAVRRRFPFIVSLFVKPEYCRAGTKMLDPTKLPPSDGKFPNYWDIQVQKIVPITDKRIDTCKLEIAKKFGNIETFLAYYGAMTMEHERIQTIQNHCVEDFKSIEICNKCFYTKGTCSCPTEIVMTLAPQADFWPPERSWFWAPVEPDTANEEEEEDGVFFNWEEYHHHANPTYFKRFQEWTFDIFVRIATWWVNLSWMRWFFWKIIEIRWLGNFMLACLGRYLKFDEYIRLLNRNLIPTNSRYKTIMCCTAVLALAVGGYVTYRSFSGTTTSVKKEKKKTKKVKRVRLSVQGNKLGTTEADLPKSNTENVWYNNTIELNRFDLPLSSGSLVKTSPEELRDLFAQNCVRLFIESVDAPNKVSICGVFIQGQYVLTNNHAFRNGTVFDITIVTQVPFGLTGNVSTRVLLGEIKRDPTRDIAIFRVQNAPPRKNILKFWLEKPITITKMVMLRREKSGDMNINPVVGVYLIRDCLIEALNQRMDLVRGIGIEETKLGDCGSLAIAQTPQGAALCGIHTLGGGRNVGVPLIYKQNIDNLLSSFEDIQLSVQGEGAPLPELNGKPLKLVAPHEKSLVRWIETGSLKVYGTIGGFMAKPKSKVCSTPLCKVFLEHYNLEKPLHGPPPMQGYAPWRKNLIKMVDPKYKVHTPMIDLCASSFATEIMRKLPVNWEGSLVILSKKASVNGLPGVKFIDGINRNSSMGHPWCSTKRKFLIESVDEVYPNGVDFSQEIWDRVDEILSRFKQGKRSYSIFVDHLKDEAIPLPKIAEGKVRLFSGAPIDLSLVIRMYLLSFVKLLQDNKFAFEAAPGTCCQSIEWQRIYEYLVHYGTHKIVAGDYGSYDKYMLATFILKAFKVIIEIHRTAGWDDEELLVISCIGHEIAFHISNLKGDLVEFFGTNPSGHPLTVIINSIVNSLYMRYVFYVLYLREQGVDHYQLQTFDEISEFLDINFADFVKLMTYGDDNIMGVSDDVPWFNHTAIQENLSEIGVVYTMADKGAASVPYIDISECSFLKRKWRFDNDVGAHLCPLEEESIIKSLTMWVPSPTIDEYAQMVAVITSANNEYFFYGKEVFNKKRSLFQELLKQEPYVHYVRESTLPTWDDLRLRFWNNSDEILGEEEDLAV